MVLADRLFRRHASLKASPNSCLRNAGNGCPVGGAPTLAKGFDPERISTITILLRAISPAAVIGGIAFCVVDSVDGLAWRRITHVLVKCRQVHPLIANANSPGPVVAVGPIVWVQAAPQHIGPNVTDSRSIQPVLRVYGYRNFSTEASARRYGASLKMVRSDHRGVPARARTLPRGLFSFVCSFSFNRQTTKRLAGQVDGSNHFALPMRALIEERARPVRVPAFRELP